MNISRTISDCDEKPIIRHCKNCKWCKESLYDGYCTVKYQYIDYGRIKHCFVDFTKRKKVASNDG